MNDDTIAIIYQQLLLDNTPIWSLAKPPENCAGVAKVCDCLVYAGDTQVMSFGESSMNPPPPFYDLQAPYSNTSELDSNGI